MQRAQHLLGLLSPDELVDAVVYLDGMVYGSDEPDAGDDTSDDLDNDVESIGLNATGDEEADRGE